MENTFSKSRCLFFFCGMSKQAVPERNRCYIDEGAIEPPFGIVSLKKMDVGCYELHPFYDANCANIAIKLSRLNVFLYLNVES